MVLNAPYHSSMEKEVVKAANIINSFFSSTFDADSSIPAEMIQKCAGLAFLTVVKAGMIWTGKLGTGLVIARLEDGSWSAPSGIGTAGVGFGAEIGGEIVDFMIVLGSPSAVKTFKKGTQVSVGAGLDLAIGPVGRAAGASFNASGGGLSGNYSYSRAKGAFAGIGLHGSTIMIRGEMNNRFYGREVTPMEILNGHVQPPPGSCDVLFEAIRNACNSKALSPSSGPNAGQSAYPTYGSSRNSSSSGGNRSSFNGSFNNGNTSGSNYNTPNATSATSSASASANRSSFTSSASANPDPNDPRLRRYSSYRSERELYAEFQTRKSSGASSGGGYTPAAAPVAAAAPAGGYAATSSYSSAPAPAAGYASAAGYAAAPVAAPAGHHGAPGAPIATYAHPTNPNIKYTSYPAPAPNPNYTPRPQAESLYNSFVKPAATPQAVPPIPSAATGAEMKEVYNKVINFISTRCPYANVQVFKDNCRRFGQDQMSLDGFFSYLLSICSHALMKELVPDLVRLLPTQEKRERLWTQYIREILLIKI